MTADIDLAAMLTEEHQRTATLARLADDEDRFRSFSRKALACAIGPGRDYDDRQAWRHTADLAMRAADDIKALIAAVQRIPRTQSP